MPGGVLAGWVMRRSNDLCAGEDDLGFGWASVRPQDRIHAPAPIIGNRNALELLRDAHDRPLRERRAPAPRCSLGTAGGWSTCSRISARLTTQAFS